MIVHFAPEEPGAVGVRSRALSRDFTLGATTRLFTLSYVTAGVGLALTF